MPRRNFLLGRCCWCSLLSSWFCDTVVTKVDAVGLGIVCRRNFLRRCCWCSLLAYSCGVIANPTAPARLGKVASGKFLRHGERIARVPARFWHWLGQVGERWPVPGLEIRNRARER